RVSVAIGNIDHPVAGLDKDVAPRRHIEQIHRPQQRRFTRAGQAPPHRYLAFVDGEVRSGAAEHGAGLFEYLLTRRSLVDHGKRGVALRAEDDVDVLELDRGVHLAAPVPILLMRSRMMARMTMASPASSPSGILTEFSALTTGLPSPSAPISAAI